MENVGLPYKDKDKQREVVRLAVRKFRAYKKKLMQQARKELSDVWGANRVREELPSVYELVFGEKGEVREHGFAQA